MIVRIQRRLYRRQAHHAQRVHLKGRACRCRESFHQECRIPTHQKAAVTQGVFPFDRSEIVAYSPLPIFRTDAKPLSTSGVSETRAWSATSANECALSVIAFLLWSIGISLMSPFVLLPRRMAPASGRTRGRGAVITSHWPIC